MSFFFKSKKSQQQPQAQNQNQNQNQNHSPSQSQSQNQPPPVAATRNIHTSEGTSSIPSSSAVNTLNGIREKDRDGEPTQPFGPNGSSNPGSNQVNPSSTSPVQSNNPRRDRSDSEPQAPRSQPVNGTQPLSGPNHTLYPWSQRRMNFPSPQLTPFPRYGAAINAI
ncbi:hypothetical protein FQN49_007870, partial [Arthroderma sp. PD_2]